MGVRQACVLVALLSGCDALFGLDHLNPVDAGAADAPGGDAAVDAMPSFCELQPLKKACADFESAPYGLASNFTEIKMGTGAQPHVGVGGLLSPNLLAFAVAANPGTSTDYSVARAIYTDTGFNGMIAFSVKAVSAACNARIATIEWPPSDYGVIVQQKTNGFSFALFGTLCPVGTMMTAATLDLAGWHRVEIYVNVPAGTAVVSIDGEMHTFSCQPGFAGTAGLMRTDLGMSVNGPHAGCEVAFDNILIR